MSFRDDLEAARQRVASLERDVAAARERHSADRIRIGELKRALAADRPANPLRRSRLPRLIGAAILLPVVSFLVLRTTIRPRDPETVIDAYRMLKARLGLGGEIISLRADRVDRIGRIHLEEDAKFSVITSHDGDCDEIFFSADDDRLHIPCDAAPAVPIRCTPASVWQKIVDKKLRFGDYARLSWTAGTWIAVDRASSKSITLPDDCPEQFWPPHG